MTTGTLALAVVLLATGTVPPDVVPMNSRNFQIPIQILAGEREKIKELLLFCSTDQGATWNQTAVAPPDKDAFEYYAPTDGVYWFNICVVDSQGNREPPDIYKSPPRLKVLVDTLKPNVRIISAERQGDDIVVAWEIQEDHPDLTTLKLEYRAAEAPTWMWYTTSVTPGMTGQARFRFLNSGPALVRLQVTDQAGNLADAQVEVKARVGGSDPSIGALPPAGTPSTPGAGMPSASTAGPYGTGTSPMAPLPSSYTSGPAPLSPPGVNTLVSPAPDRLPSVQPASLTQHDPRSLPDRAWSPPGPSGYQQVSAVSTEQTNRFSASAGNVGSPLPPPLGARWSYNPAVPLQVTNSTQVSLDYEVTKVGPSGLGSVELYLTQDEGQNWQRYANDPKMKPPMTVNLPGEGVYGLRLVVGSRAGLGRRPPQPGDPPQMRLEVDTTPPMAKLFYPQPDPSRRDALLLTWNASDRNLLPNPVTLQWSERPDGAWQTIAADLTNTGRYIWQLSPGLPYRVYLRLAVRDAAGNVGVDETPEPVLIDLHEPEGRLLGITGTARRP